MTKTKTRPGRGRPSASAAESKHRAILEAAVEEFVRAGFRGASMREIAAKADVSTRTLYNRYPDKHSLFEGCLEFTSRQIRPVEASDDGDLRTQLLAHCIGMQQELSKERSRQLSLLIYRESADFEELRRIAREQFERQQVAPVAAMLEKAGLRSNSVHLLALQFVTMALGEWQRRLLFGGPRLSQVEMIQHAEFVTTLFLEGILRFKRPSR